MVEQRNIIVLGSGIAGLQTTHYILKHILPAVKARKDAEYRVYNIAPSSKWFFRIASPRVSTSTTRLAIEKVTFDIHENFKQYSKDDFTFVEASATSLDTAARKLSYRTSKGADEDITYHALIIATGSKTYHASFSAAGAIEDTVNAVTATNEKVNSAKSIVISGGGPTAVEFAGEVGEHLNGKPGWFSKPQPKASITIVTSAKQLLPNMSVAAGKRAEASLKGLGVHVSYNTRVESTSTTDNGRTIVHLGSGETLETDLYVPAVGVLPNSSWLPKDLLNDKNYLIADSTLRVEKAGSRVYTIGDIASSSRNNAWSIMSDMPVLFVNLKRDLLSYNAAEPDARPKGKDRLVVPSSSNISMVPIGTGGGVGEINGWRVPGFFVWLAKGRDFLIAMSAVPTANGDSVKKEVKWTAEEAAL